MTLRMFYHFPVIEVDCYAGHRGEETPRRVIVDGDAFRVVRVVARWSSPESRFFEVETEDGRSCVLRHDTKADCWELLP